MSLAVETFTSVSYYKNRSFRGLMQDFDALSDIAEKRKQSAENR